MNDAGTNWAPLAQKLAFAYNTNVNYTTGKTLYEIVFGAKPQTPLSVKAEFYRNKHKLCCCEFCTDLLPHTHNENSTKKEVLQKSLRPQFSQALLDRERDFKRISSSTSERCREQTARSHAYRSRFKLGHHLEFLGQKILYEESPAKLFKKSKATTMTFRSFHRYQTCN